MAILSIAKHRLIFIFIYFLLYSLFNVPGMIWCLKCQAENTLVAVIPSVLCMFWWKAEVHTVSSLRSKILQHWFSSCPAVNKHSRGFGLQLTFHQCKFIKYLAVRQGPLCLVSSRVISCEKIQFQNINDANSKVQRLVFWHCAQFTI